MNFMLSTHTRHQRRRGALEDRPHLSDRKEDETTAGSNSTEGQQQESRASSFKNVPPALLTNLDGFFLSSWGLLEQLKRIPLPAAVLALFFLPSSERVP